MHPHAELIDRLYRHLAAHEPEAMAQCYHEKATFEDIAFRLEGRDEILAMWKLVTQPGPNLKVTFEVLKADDVSAHARVIDDYIFTETQRPVHNVIDSYFRFERGLIIEHQDKCDPVLWANMAMTGPKAWVAGHCRLARAITAKKKLKPFLPHAAR